MELMASCFDKLLKLIQKPMPEQVLGKLTFAVCVNNMWRSRFRIFVCFRQLQHLII